MHSYSKTLSNNYFQNAEWTSNKSQSYTEQRISSQNFMAEKKRIVPFSCYRLSKAILFME